MTLVRRSLPAQTHPLFRAVFDDWYARAGALSALPDAPVVPDEPRRRRLVIRGGRPARRIRTAEVLRTPGACPE
ncbi:hypothetical protein [Streptomyces cylindrosporus]|uniref:Uncharacterized protein n=1 Tax=Streptomyces cylindrosporus TaxID=2927583 RepID=A0ABS9YEL7_9ACTN|nr:hypothetical protein [Streptomyces cylindrosporus]MCI3275414.1 hypothetical protein [Streptomyces cylindrosporus]